MLIILMYHQIITPGEPQCYQLFAQHLQYLADNFTIVLPGSPLPKNKLAICLTFDDAYFDFYHSIFPLLQSLEIPAVLGIPVNYIQPSTTVPSKARLAIPYPRGLDKSIQQEFAPLCTWSEIQQMVASNLIRPASHSLNHLNLTAPDTDLMQELSHSQSILQQQLQQIIDTFIYPFGKTNSTVQKLVSTHYSYAMRIGSAINFNWHPNNGLLYRVNADPFWQQGKPLANNQWLLGKYAKYLINRLRGK